MLIHIRCADQKFDDDTHQFVSLWDIMYVGKYPWSEALQTCTQAWHFPLSSNTMTQRPSHRLSLPMSVHSTSKDQRPPRFPAIKKLPGAAEPAQKSGNTKRQSGNLWENAFRSQYLAHHESWWPGLLTKRHVQRSPTTESKFLDSSHATEISCCHATSPVICKTAGFDERYLSKLKAHWAHWQHREFDKLVSRTTLRYSTTQVFIISNR